MQRASSVNALAALVHKSADASAASPALRKLVTHASRSAIEITTVCVALSPAAPIDRVANVVTLGCDDDGGARMANAGREGCASTLQVPWVHQLSSSCKGVTSALSA